MKRYQIDFAVRELDVPEEQARGVRFSEAVTVDKIFDYLTRIRDAIVTLVGGPRGSSQPPPAAPATLPPPGPLPHRRLPEADRPWSRPLDHWVHRPAPSDPRWSDDVAERIRRSWGVLRASVH